MSDLKTSEVLDRAADLLQGNWTQGDWFADGKMCLEGGIIAAMGRTYSEVSPDWTAFENCSAYRAVQEYLGDKRPLYSFNDSSIRTEEQVIAALRGAAEQERQKENAR